MPDLEMAMIRSTALLSLLALGACGGDSDDDGKSDTVDTDTPVPDDTIDTAQPEPDLTGLVGSIVLGHWPADASYDDDGFFAYGLFIDDDAGVQNLAMCFFGGGPCVDSYPGVGETVSPDPNLDAVYYGNFYDAGPTVTAGSTNMDRDQSYGIPLYFGQPASLGFGTPGGLLLDGDLAEVNEVGLFTHVDQMEATAPDPSETILAGPGSVVDFAWTPGTNGNVYLQVSGSLTGLDDSAGAYSLDVDSLGLSAPFDFRLVVLTRITHDDIDANGNTVRVETRSDQWYYIEYEDTYGWTELVDTVDMADDCTAALALPPIGAGQYYGDTAAYANSHDLGHYNPISDYASQGLDGVVPVALLAGQQLDVSYSQTQYDASVYLLSAACDIGAPLAGADETLDGQAETFSYTATVDETVYLVLDAWTPGGGGTYTLDLQIL